MSEGPTVERIHTLETREVPKASPALMLRIATGEFDTKKTPSNTSPTEISKHSYEALNANHEDVRKREQAERDVINREFLEKKGYKDQQITPAVLRDMHMADWAHRQSFRLGKMLTFHKQTAPTMFQQEIVALAKLSIVVNPDQETIGGLDDQFYYAGTNQMGIPGEFYTKFCTGNTNQNLLQALTFEDIVALQGFLTDVLGSTQAYDAFRATKQTQNAIASKADFPQGNGQVDPNDPILTFFKKGEELLKGKTPQIASKKPAPNASASDVDEEKLTGIDLVKRDIFQSEAAVNAEAHQALLQEMLTTLQEEKRQGKGKLRGTIQETATSPDGQRVIHDGYVVFIPGKVGEKLITIGDIHGDLATIEHILEKERFFENMESGNPTMRLVLLGDLVDRGKKSVEVMTAIMQLKLRYKDRVHAIAADHETTKPGLSEHEFPNQLKDKFGTKGEEIYQNYQQIFDNMPKLVVTGNGVPIAHGGPIAEKLTLSQIAQLDGTDKGKYVARQLTWSDPVIKTEHLQKQKEDFITSLQEAINNAANQPIITLTTPANVSLSLSDAKKALQMLQTLPNGFYPNIDRVAASPTAYFDALFSGFHWYSQSGLEGFLDTIGATVAVRAHQISAAVEGRNPLMFDGKLQTIHSTGRGSPDTAYAGSEFNPTYAVIDLGQQLTHLGPEQIKPVWP